ncbi:MAG: hypothetical protein DMF92_12405 [Acidobacteria bacterium]|nr:MAG: hypothetical protein DMF92_12405 [Acidobacteriota bacterium]
MGVAAGEIGELVDVSLEKLDFPAPPADVFGHRLEHSAFVAPDPAHVMIHAVVCRKQCPGIEATNQPAVRGHRALHHASKGVKRALFLESVRPADFGDFVSRTRKLAVSSHTSCSLLSRNV